jgi:hypothetical protein
MRPDDVDHYFSEIVRVIKPGGRTLISYYILNEESKALMNQGLATFDFKYSVESCFTIDEAFPENAIAYNEKSVLDLYEKYGFDLCGPIRYGSWAGRKNVITSQDLIIAVKR